jgi:hypothetical protein
MLDLKELRLSPYFIVTHVYDVPGGLRELKFIGVYSTREEADSAIARARTRPGFADHPGDFIVMPFELDQDYESEGFEKSTFNQNAP